MSSSQKALKVISIITIVYAVIVIASGIFVAAGSALLVGGTVDVAGNAESASAVAVLFGGVAIVGGVIDLIIGFLGLRGAKDPRKVGPFLVLCVVGFVLGLISVGMAVARGSFQPTSLINVVIIAICLFLAAQVKKQA